ncbi:MAG: ATP-binding cassette, subfamily bacterial RamA/AmfB, partial [Solirubrobacteraceae bacterium]|nr:ATP-binding cassette, subfamily bacterial RamA/AmfB [Solirubrobacteraceae bacterium]
TAARTDAVVWLDRGRVRAMAPHRELWRDPDYRALFEADEQAAIEPDEQPTPVAQPPDAITAGV